jgi:hypothetical protein
MSMLVKQGKTKFHEIVPLNHHKQPPRPPRAALLTSAHFSGGQREQKKTFPSNVYPCMVQQQPANYTAACKNKTAEIIVKFANGLGYLVRKYYFVVSF